jgi:uncharacterized protein YbjT (DUF2867 family)
MTFMLDAQARNNTSDGQIRITDEEMSMFAVTGITGQVGSAVAKTLLQNGAKIRAVVRNAEKAHAWAEQGCEVFPADLNDTVALEQAFKGVEGVFVVMPPIFDPSPGFPESRRLISSLRKALEEANPPKVVCLSTIGAQAKQPNLLNQLGNLEQELSTLPFPVSFLRAAWFMENSAWDVTPAREMGVVYSFLQPLDKPVPMVSTADVGSMAAHMLQESRQGKRIVELEGPQRVTPNDIAASFSKILDFEVRMQVVPRSNWEPLFRSQGMTNPLPRMQMLDGFNEGWIEFEGGQTNSSKGSTAIGTVLRSLVTGGN